MLSPRATHLFLKYFDSIDETLSRRLSRQRVWDEEALTFLLTELFDEESQADHLLPYPHAAFLKDLAATDEPISVQVRIDTHSYPKSMERYVTQSDIGMIVAYDDQFESKSSFRRGWLLQAKRIFPSKQRRETGFSTRSSFDSVDRQQHERMRRLRDWAQCDFIRYMLYCPRPSALDRGLREHLAAARSQALSRDIFDYTLGLELRDDLMSDKPTVAAGCFIALLDAMPDNLLAVHASIFSGTMPLAWFIVMQIAQAPGIRSRQQIEMPRTPADPSNLNNPIVDAIIRGDAKTFSEDSRLMEVLDDPEHARILPAHTLTVRVVNGIDRPRDTG